MKSRVVISGLAFLAVACITGAAIANDQAHSSLVNIAAGAGAVQADVDGTPSIVLEVGKPAEFDIKYQIGMVELPSGAGAITPLSSDIKDPEYTLLWDGATQNPSPYPPGLGFSSETGVSSGTPTQTGTWSYHPAVRDKKDGESPYRGDGFWFSQFTTWDGKTWSESKDAMPIVVLPPPSAKALMLECTGNSLDLLLQVDYASGIVRVFGNDGKIGGVYHANISDDFIAWGKMHFYPPSIIATSVKLDRKTGAFSTTPEVGNAISGSCQKRAAEQKF